ncbi:nitrous oxide reductase accessory protein NosL [Schinkia azotoformans]|uniref:nitrous oxide reductase accessory protein NosL n=1 Tax=Schinkia azotoformans TaxID=1454 RepID=UPI002DBBD2F9|nr:nitrous oxide reductase accessory protein NosL [Schinkia azotoformans]MEC1718175.1 nitrous oxide reductase accessory protein NosL [Schinkia azotoformans]MEC1740119.1 nitrous oxide reductase accessory protein NosL [Schinkia azotoformans]MEC1744663.1 nitrous oxide reductase accessory protein NosL [Schinkia azotoformans]MEC1758308.1 nitrous oxide reductase accessory protein NosL [Schinkia azotoformans]MEC1768223.1 nitrous oxide reductase accessory protein NosL [Schinkia azotoformans]
MGKHIFKNFFPLFLLVLLLASCGQVGTIMPEAIDEEVDICEACTMMVQDNQYSAQIVTTNGKVFKFDDIGCMAMYINDNLPVGQLYARDFYSHEWMEVEQAYFVFTKDVETPMNYGFLAFSSKTNVEKFLAESSGQEMMWNQVKETMKERSRHNENEHTHN